LDIQLDVDEVRVERARLGDPTRAARPKIRPPLGRQIGHSKSEKSAACLQPSAEPKNKSKAALPT
jgi:hypothetical protein